MTQITQTFAALSDPTRFAIVERLLTEGEKSAGDLQSTAEISAPAISRHLKVLRNAGVIHQRTAAQKRFYRVSPEAIQGISAWTMSHREFWESSMNRLHAALMKETTRK
ncbi:MAG: metalloregulator ArsR/SmtB family transcription factor [Paracoccaceae bacterium]|nr:metalloregulator ArsR/SmtB family transcription factor [Paracoccaceae bacterium]